METCTSLYFQYVVHTYNILYDICLFVSFYLMRHATRQETHDTSRIYILVSVACDQNDFYRSKFFAWNRPWLLKLIANKRKPEFNSKKETKMRYSSRKHENKSNVLDGEKRGINAIHVYKVMHTLYIIYEWMWEYDTPTVKYMLFVVKENNKSWYIYTYDILEKKKKKI